MAGVSQPAAEPTYRRGWLIVALGLLSMFGPLSLDLYLPVKTPERPLPVVLWIHGGGWKSGTKENCPLIWLAAEGHAVVSLNYRLSWLARWPAPLDDVLATMQRHNAHLALVIDEHGGTAGIISLEDLFEEVIGEMDEEASTTPSISIASVRRYSW